ncbi:MAG: hypothetical protein WAU01_17640 [Saprospiraceae bacterium]
MQKNLKTTQTPPVKKRVAKTPVKSVKKVSKEMAAPNKTLVGSAFELAKDIKGTTIEMKNVVVDSVTDFADKVDFSDSVNKLKESAEVINAEVKEVTNELTKEVKEMNAEISKIAEKGMKQIGEKLDVNKSISAVKKVAKETNKKVAKNAKSLVKTTKDLANEVAENMKVTERLDGLKKVVSDVNTYVQETAIDVIENIETNGSKWQGITEKAIKTGFKLADKQQDLMFLTLESLRSQVTKASNKLIKVVKG